MARYSEKYLDGLLDSTTFQDLVALQGILTAPPHFDSHEPDYGLPPHFFVVVEALAWFAQSGRSGVWTYFEATPRRRQQAMYEVLLEFAPQDFAQRYQFGMNHWQDPQQIASLESWMKEMDKAASEWMRTILRVHRTEYKALCA